MIFLWWLLAAVLTVLLVQLVSMWLDDQAEELERKLAYTGMHSRAEDGAV